MLEPVGPDGLVGLPVSWLTRNNAEFTGPDMFDSATGAFYDGLSSSTPVTPIPHESMDTTVYVLVSWRLPGAPYAGGTSRSLRD
ncbi:MAG TPA: hypothetical protein VI365_05590 [Trebonia sp.]